MLAERVLGSMIGMVLAELGLTTAEQALRIGKKSGDNITIDQILQIPKKMVDLAGAVQAAHRTSMFASAFEGEKFDAVKLLDAQEKIGKSSKIGLDKIDEEPWIDNAELSITKQAQATTSVVRLFVDILNKADALAGGVNKSPLREHEEIKDAIRAIGELAYIHKKQVIDAFRKESEISKNAGSDENAKKYSQAADILEQNLVSTRISKIGKSKDGPVAALFRGITHGLEWLGYKKDGSARGFMGGIFRNMARVTGKWGYDLPDTEQGEEKAAAALMKGIKHGMDAIVPELQNDREINISGIYGWLNKRAEQIEPGLATKIGLAAATETDANVAKVVAEADSKATEKAK